MAMYVTIQVSANVARVLRQRAPPTVESQELSETAEELGVVLEPLHPDVEDPRLALYFTVEVPDPATAQEVIARLQHCQAIEAAYVKPPDALP